MEKLFHGFNSSLMILARTKHLVLHLKEFHESEENKIMFEISED